MGDTGLEVINATTGKDEMGRASRLCKHALYSRWMRIHAKVYIPEWNIFHFHFILYGMSMCIFLYSGAIFCACLKLSLTLATSPRHNDNTFI